MPVRAAPGRLHDVDVDLNPNEASDLLIVEDPAVLGAHGWDAAFYTVLDEGVIERSVGVLGHRPDRALEGWESVRLRLKPTAGADKTEDAEACTRHDGWVWLVGSHYGSKDGPLEARRHFFARFREEELSGDLGRARPDLQVVRDRFAVHRAVNDALARSGVELLPLGPRMHAALIDQTIRLGRKRRKRWAGRVREGDWPLNVEAAAFSPWGTLLLGLRFPVTRDGHPLIVELLEPDALFEGDPEQARAGAVWVLSTAGTREVPLGFRALSVEGREVHAILGNLDAEGKGSVLLEDFPEGNAAHSQHWTFSLRRGGHNARARQVRDFPGLDRVEGLAYAEDHWFYVVDYDDAVRVHFLKTDRPRAGRGGASARAPARRQRPRRGRPAA